MTVCFWKKGFKDEEWAEDERYPMPLKPDHETLMRIKDAAAHLPDDSDEESFEEFDIPAGYEYREGWIYIGESKEIVRDEYYYDLPSELKAEFKDLFVERNNLIVSRCPAYIIDGDNTLFFQLVFTYITRFRKIISIGLLENLYEFLFYRFIERPQIISRLNDKLIRIYFARRDEDDNIIKCEEKCREDVAFNFEYIPDFPRNLDSYKRLVILLESRGELYEAKAFCERAIALGMTDRTKADYTGRLEKIEKKIARQKRKAINDAKEKPE
ncbi:MAG: hypothetical protein LBQ40_07695 [Clostridiales bacterium]|jgi:hypothetical protein|nr:hypothetical protein [Clostridiales bacterium]